MDTIKKVARNIWFNRNKREMMNEKIKIAKSLDELNAKQIAPKGEEVIPVKKLAIISCIAKDDKDKSLNKKQFFKWTIPNNPRTAKFLLEDLHEAIRRKRKYMRSWLYRLFHPADIKRDRSIIIHDCDTFEAELSITYTGKTIIPNNIPEVMYMYGILELKVNSDLARSLSPIGQPKSKIMKV